MRSVGVGASGCCGSDGRRGLTLSTTSPPGSGPECPCPRPWPLSDVASELGEVRSQLLRAATSGRFDDALDRLKARLADPTGDRVVEALRLTRHVGGRDLGRVLRSLSGFLRDDLRTRGELESRQSWTVNGARIAVAAPWLVLLSMAGRPDVVDRYSTPTGGLIVVGGAAVCVVAYRLMMRIGRLPSERRVFA